LVLGDYEDRTREAVRHFWRSRQEAAEEQRVRGTDDQGTRGTATKGKHMDGFCDLLTGVVEANGLPREQISTGGRLLTLPGYFRPMKKWDFVVMNQARLVAAVELKSQVGSLGNNANNRAEEAIGQGTDLWTAFREGAFGDDAPQPFVGYLFLLEDSPAAHRARSHVDTHFPVFPEFVGAGYAERYDILCRKLVQEQLFTAATVILSSKSSLRTGDYTEMDPASGLKNFVSTLAGHVAAEAARQ